MTRAQALAQQDAEERADAVSQAAELARNQPQQPQQQAPPGTPNNRRMSSVGMPRETKAQKAQREAALRRRETLELNELEKYGETYETKKAAAAAGKDKEAAKPHSFLRRADSLNNVGSTPGKGAYSARVGAAGGASAVTGSTNSVLPPSAAPSENASGTSNNRRKSVATSQPQQNAFKPTGIEPPRSQPPRGAMARTPANANVYAAAEASLLQEAPRPGAAKKEANPVQVIVRKRPPKEGETDCVQCHSPLVVCLENKQKVDLTKYVHPHKFCYDGSYGTEDTTTGLYEESVQSLIQNFVSGGSSTCFCFGQTASGKTFTLFGAGGGQVMDASTAAQSDPEAGGVYMLAARDAFEALEQMPDLCLSVSMFEIYGQKVRDLLDGCKELMALEDGKGVLQLVGLASHECNGMDDFIAVSNVGRGARSTTATGANATSSRSHAAMVLKLVRRGPLDAKNTPKPVLGKFSLIDLAGSERGADNENTDKTTQMEGRQINQSLLALKEVIRALDTTTKKSHAPFRQSRLTQVLEESLTGRRCQTVVIGCVSPAERDIQQTINTLRYAEGLRPSLKKNIGKHETRLGLVASALVPKQAPSLSQGQPDLALVARKERELEALRNEEAEARERLRRAELNQGDDTEYESPEEEGDDDEDGDVNMQGGAGRRGSGLEQSFGLLQHSESQHSSGFDLLDGLDGSPRASSDLGQGAGGGLGGALQRSDSNVSWEPVASYPTNTAERSRIVSVASSDFDDDHDPAPYNAYNNGGNSLANDLLFEQDMSEAEALLAKAEREPSTNQSAAKAARERRAEKQKQDALLKQQQEQLKQQKGKKQNTTMPPPAGPSANTKRGKAAESAAAKTAAAKAAAAATASIAGLSLESPGGSNAGESNADTMANRRAASAVSSLQAQVHDLKRALEEGDAVRDSLRLQLSREQERHTSMEAAWRRTCTEIEQQMENLLVEKEASESVVAQRDAEVEQLCLELEDREARIDELKLMLKKLLETANSSQHAALGASAGGNRAPLSPTRQQQEDLSTNRPSTRGKSKSTKL